MIGKLLQYCEFWYFNHLIPCNMFNLWLMNRKSTKYPWKEVELKWTFILQTETTEWWWRKERREIAGSFQADLRRPAADSSEWGGEWVISSHRYSCKCPPPTLPCLQCILESTVLSLYLVLLLPTGFTNANTTLEYHLKCHLEIKTLKLQLWNQHHFTVHILLIYFKSYFNNFYTFVHKLLVINHCLIP